MTFCASVDGAVLRARGLWARSHHGLSRPDAPASTEFTLCSKWRTRQGMGFRFFQPFMLPFLLSLAGTNLQKLK